MLKKLPIHPYAEIFPPAEKEDRERMRKSLELNGQIHKIVTFDGKVLDGVNRQDILVDDLKTSPTYIDWKDLPEEQRKGGPLAYVMASNFDRRHLTVGQKAAAAAEAVPFIQAEQKAAAAAAGGAQKKAPAHDEHSQDNGASPEDESQVPGRKGGAKKKAERKSTALAAKKFGVSTSSVEKAARLKKKDPAKFKDVKAGKTSLSKADKDAAKEKQKAQELDDAHKRITAVCGRNFGAQVKDGEILKKGRTEVIAFAAMSDADMKKTQGLIASGFPLEKARAYKMTALTMTSTIRDLGVRAIAKGVAAGGSHAEEITINDVALEITVRAAKDKDTKK